ncbi:MAG TPA: MFS transporter [Trueperaceae bacterium]|jgi:MFS family permease
MPRAVSHAERARSISTLRLMGLGSGSLGLAAVWALYNTFMPLLLAQFVASAGVRGTIMALDNVIAVLMLPVVGAWSDRLGGRLGKRIPFLLAAMPLSALLFTALPLADATLWTLLSVDVVFLLTITLFRAPLVALMPDHVPPRERSSANGVITLMAAAGGAIGLLLLSPLFDAAHWLPFAGGGVLIVIALVLVLLAADRHPPFATGGAAAEEAPALQGLFRDVRQLVVEERGGAGVLLLAVFAVFFGYSALEAQFSTFATQTLGISAGMAGPTIAATMIAYVAAAVPAGLLARRIGSASTMRIGALTMAVAAVLATLVADVSSARVVLALGGAAWALVQVPAYPLVVNQGGEAQTGFYTGMYYLFGSAASIAGPPLVGAMMDVFGNRALFYSLAVSMVVGAALVTAAKRRRVEGRAAETTASTA